MRRAALALLAMTAGCQGTPEELIDGTAEGPSVVLPFSSLYVTQLASSSVRRSRSSSPHLAPEETRDHSDDDSLLLQFYRDEGFLTAGGISYGLSSLGCYQDGISSDVLIVYEPGRKKQDSFACVGDPTRSGEEKYKINYSSTSSFDSGLLQLNGSMSASGTETYLNRTAKISVKYKEKISIRIDGENCEVIDWQQSRDETEVIPETFKHYSSDDSENETVSRSSKTECKLVR